MAELSEHVNVINVFHDVNFLKELTYYRLLLQH